jgi:hypothetical protein
MQGGMYLAAPTLNDANTAEVGQPATALLLLPPPLLLLLLLPSVRAPA